MVYDVEITPEGLRQLHRLPSKVRAAILEAAFGSIAEDLRRAGKPLRGELEGLHSARRGDFCIVYEIDEIRRTILVLRAQHRRDVYRPR